jgi:quinohemoprotein ethanol dehydrogenase
MRGIWKAVLGAAAVVAVAGLAAQAANRQPAGLVDGARIANADQHPGEWMSVGRTYDEQHYSPLTQINADTVKDLNLTWFADLGSVRGVEASPLVIDGVLYNTQPWNITTAYDAKTGKVLWTYDPKVPQQTGRYACCDIVTRGVAAWKGKIIIATLDGRLVAVDAKTGRKVWEVQTLDDGSPWAYVITGAPRVFDGKVVIGNSGAEAAARGYVTAYDAETGKKEWRFYIVPGDPAQGYKTKAEADAAKTWKGEWWKKGGGGTAWDSIVYDPKLKLVYVGTGNGGPWPQYHRSPGGGDNLYIASVVALHVEDGSYAWHYQETPGDEWDYTSTQPIVLADLKIGGRDRQVLLHAPKNGFFYVLDRKTGELISAKAYTDITWATGIDMKTGRPIENPAARYGEKPVLLSPSQGGVHNWNPMAFSPKTGLVYFPATNSSALFAVDMAFKQQPGGMSQLGLASTGFEEERKRLMASAPKSDGFLIAYDPVQQKEVWRAQYARSGSGGVLATAGNLVFQGTIESTFAAYRADNGQKVWEMDAQQVPIAAPVSYEIDGEQYIAVNAGFGGGTVHGPVNDDTALKRYEYGRLLVYKLGGKAKLPPLVYKKPVLDFPPMARVSGGDALKGQAVFAKNCAVCHGDNARGGVKDLRRMTRQTHDEFNDIVLGGKRAANGMASFADTLSKEDAEMVHRFIIARIIEDWQELNKTN